MENGVNTTKQNTGKKKKKQAADSFTEKFLEMVETAPTTEDIAPVMAANTITSGLAPILTSSPTVGNLTAKEEDDRKWFEKGEFEDGYQFGDLWKTVLGTTNDIRENAAAGVLGMGEKIVDAGAYLAGGVGGLFGADEFKDKTADFIKKDLYDEKKVAKKLLGFSSLERSAKILGADSETSSVLGDKSDSLVQSAGQLGATAALQAVGVPWYLTTGVTSFGGEAESALNEGATYGEAGLSAAISAGAEILTEKISGAIKFGGKALDDGLTQKIARDVSSKAVRTLSKFGLDAGGEGFEEVLSGLMSAIGQKITYADDKELKELFSLEDAWESFVGGAVLGGGSNVMGAVKAKVNGVDAVTGLTANEQKVVDQEYKNRVAEAEKTGKQTEKQKAKIYDEVLRDMERGYISTDTIEEILGGESYKTYKDTIESEDALTKEYEELGKLTAPTLAEQTRYKELHEQMKSKDTSTRDQLKSKLSDEVMGLVKGDRLSESYNERSRRGQAFEADLTKYDAKQQEIIKKAVESGFLNNTNRTHEFVDTIAKIAADKGVPFDFTNNAKLKESGFAVEGKTVNGYVTNDGISINIDSAKAMNSVVGHEITHVLEGTELYKVLQQTVFDYAKSKGEFDSRHASLSEIYNGIEGANVDAELTADLVGDYLFTDREFVKNLSVSNRNVFQKIYDEIKYLAKVATAGSKEARELEKVKKAFEEAYRATKNTADDSGVKYKLSDIEIDRKFVDYADTKSAGIAVDEKVADLVSRGKTVELSADSISSYETNTEWTDKKAVRELLKEVLEPNLGVSVEFEHDGQSATAYLTRDGINHSVGGPASPRKAAAFEMFNALVKNSEYAFSSENDPHSKSSQNIEGNIEWDTFVAAATVNGEPYPVVFKIRSIDSDVRSQIYEMATKNETGFSHGDGSVESPADAHPNYGTSPISGDTVAQKQQDVKHSADDTITEAQNSQGLNISEEATYSLSKDTEHMDKAITANDTSMKVDSSIMEEAKVLRERIAARMNEIKDRGLVTLPDDVEGNTYVANSSYDGTEENTTICPRSLASEAFMDAVSEYLGRPLTVEEQIYISQDLQGRTLTPECMYCYVATDRKAYRAFLGEYVNQRDAVIQKLQADPSVDVSRSGNLYKEFLNGRKDTNPMYSRFKMWVDTYKSGKPMLEAGNLASISKLMGDINSEFGAELKPQIVDAMKYAQSASWAKKRVGYVAYNGHILKWKQDRINKLNSHYGLRMYSFSDFHPAFVLENMQMITDASVRGLKMLGYTKDTDFVEIFAPTGMNINISTFGFESGGEVFENNLTGASWEQAKALREQYPNVGVTFVATNDTLVEWALAQDWVDVVIPYHLVRTGTEVAKALNYTNYTGESSDTKSAEWKKGDAKYIAPTEHNNDKATYLAALEKNHLKPRFERFISNPNYMKLVNECRQPASMSKPVQPVFNEDAAMRSLAKLEANGFYQPIGGSVDRMYEIAGEVAENMKRDLAPTMSLSNTGEAAKQYGNYNVYGKDIALEDAPDVAPVAETKVETKPPVSETKVSDDIAPVAEKEAAVQEEPKETKVTTRKELHQNIVDGIKARFNGKGFDFDKVLKSAKNLPTFSTVDNTPQRVMEKALGYKEGQILSDITVNKVSQNETEGIKWLNSFTDRNNGLLKQISKQYGIKPGSKESAAAQMYAEGFYVADNNDIIEYGDAELAKDFPDAKVQANIKGLASDARIRQIYDDTLAMINESRTRNAYPEIPRLDNYFLHFRAMDDTFSRLGLPFNPNDIRAKDLPTDLNGVTADLKPGQPYFASAMHRTGKRTSFDLLGGLERYLTSAKNQIYHIDDIQTLRALRNYIADTYGQANGLEGLDALSEEEAQDRIEKVYDSHLSTFAKFLNEEANILAGKTALIDRGLEGIIGRRGITFLNTLNGQVGSNMVGYNISSSLTNFIPVAQTFAKTNKFDFVKAFAQTVANKTGSLFGKTDGFAEQSPVMIRRKGADRFYRTAWQKVSDPGYALMGAVDSISTELIARTKYNELTRKGMDSQKAHYETDKWVSRLMGDRSLGQQPQLYNSKMLGLVTKFQLEVRNQLDSQFYDTIQEAKASNEEVQNGLERNARIAAKVTSTFVQLAVAQHLFGKTFESVAGYNPAFDIIEVLMTTFGWDDEEDSEDTALDNIEEGFLALLEDLPYTSTLTGGRIPISSALPVKELVKGVDDWGNEKSRWETLGEVAPYYLMPGGYGQVKKTTQGLSMFSDEHPVAGSYTDSGNLRFPVEDTLKNRIQAGIFGQWASENAGDYFDNERKPLNEKQIQEFIDVDIPIRDYWEYREGLSGLDKLSEKADYIDSLDLPIDKKNLLINNLSGRKEDIDMTGYDDYGSFDEFDFAVKNPEKYEVAQKVGGYEAYMGYKEDMKDMKIAEKAEYIANLDLTTAQKNALINGETDRKEPIDLTGYNTSVYSSFEEFEYSKEYPENYAVARSVGGYEAYKGYSGDLYDIKADKDSNGKSISGSRKEKVLDYINGLDIDYGEKLILFKNEYNADDTYNYEIIDYLNSREDLSYEDMETILKKLGFNVSSDGTITW